MIINKRIAITVASIAITGAFGATALASQSSGQDGSRAGWGQGDKNHVHTGPAGQSVNVGGSQTKVKVENTNTVNATSGSATGTNAKSGNVSVTNYFSTVYNFFAGLAS